MEYLKLKIIRKKLNLIFLFIFYYPSILLNLNENFYLFIFIYSSILLNLNENFPIILYIIHLFYLI